MVWNKDARSQDYTEMQNAYRPSHADYTNDAKFGHRDYRGGGRASASETVFARFAEAIGWPGLPSDPRFENDTHRVANEPALRVIITEWTGARTVAEERVRENGAGAGGLATLCLVLTRNVDKS